MKQFYAALIGLVFVVSLCATPSSWTVAANTLHRGTGLINIPSAEVLADGELSVGYTHLSQQGYVSLNLGVFSGVEVGISSVVGDSEQSVKANLKVQLLAEEQITPAVAVGLELQEQVAGYFLVASKQLGNPSLRAHIGVGTDQFNKGFAGISTVLNPVTVTGDRNRRPLPLTTFVVEYDGSNLNTGALLGFSPELQGRLFLSDFDRLGLGLRYKVRF